MPHPTLHATKLGFRAVTLLSQPLKGYALHFLTHMGTRFLPLPSCEVKVKVAQSCSALCEPMDYTVHAILQA